MLVCTTALVLVCTTVLALVCTTALVCLTDVLYVRVVRNNGFHFVRLDGTMTSKQRTAAIEAFSDTDAHSPSVFLLSLKAGGVGINLTAACRMFFMDPVSYSYTLYRVAHKKCPQICNDVVQLSNRIQTKRNNIFKEQS